MKLLLAEYSMGAGVDEFMLEGKYMLGTLVGSFVSCGHEVFYPTAGARLGKGEAVSAGRFEDALEKLSMKCDAALVIAPDEMLGDMTAIIEENT